LINVTATIAVKAGQGSVLEAAFAAVRPETLQEPGCLRYDLQRLRRSDDRYLVLEAWESTAALKEHGSTEHFAEFGRSLAEIVAGPPDVTVYEPVGEQVALG
jgi:quinol monooxygenase YgiN